MTNTERIQANNEELRECIELAENLPDAGTGGTVTVTLQSKTVTPTKSAQEVKADAGYTALEKVTVNAIPNNYVTTTDATATSEDMRKGKTAYIDGAKITGSIEDFNGSYECSGDSTGGGSVEAWTGVFTGEGFNVYYTDETMQVRSIQTTSEPVSIIIAANTLIWVDPQWVVGSNVNRLGNGVILPIANNFSIVSV
jgi:hypothetical protein